MQSILTVLKRGSQLLTDLMTVREELDVKRGRTNTLIREIKWSSLAIASACSRVLMQEKVKEEVRSFGHLDAQDYWLGHRIGHRSEHDRYGAIHLSQRRDVVVGLREDHVGHKRRQFGAPQRRADQPTPALRDRSPARRSGPE